MSEEDRIVPADNQFIAHEKLANKHDDLGLFWTFLVKDPKSREDNASRDDIIERITEWESYSRDNRRAHREEVYEKLDLEPDTSDDESTAEDQWHIYQEQVRVRKLAKQQEDAGDAQAAAKQEAEETGETGDETTTETRFVFCFTVIRPSVYLCLICNSLHA
jgi:hypothetical protein